jgi:HK97 family phage portal protein
MKTYAYIQMGGALDKPGRKKVRDEYEEAMETYGLAVFDNKITKFEPVQMKFTDAQFLEQINASDEDIANFFGISLGMLNMGKQSYSSNDQKFGEYLYGTLDAYLVPFEQAARIRWLSVDEQGRNYFRFIRESLLRMDAKTRAETNEILIRSAQRTPNEAREKDDMTAYAEGDEFYMSSNNALVSNGGTPNG